MKKNSNFSGGGGLKKVGKFQLFLSFFIEPIPKEMKTMRGMSQMITLAQTLRIYLDHKNRRRHQIKSQPWDIVLSLSTSSPFDLFFFLHILTFLPNLGRAGLSSARAVTKLFRASHKRFWEEGEVECGL